MIKATFLYTLPSGQDVYIYSTATDVSTTGVEGLELSFFDHSGELMDMLYSSEVFNDIEDNVHLMMYEEYCEGVINEEDSAESLPGTDEEGVGSSDGG